jgi:DNA repair protein RadD
MPGGQRDDRIKAFKQGEYRALVNNGILTTGFDDPKVDYLGVYRATKSSALWVQILGRGTRPLFDTLYKPWHRPGEVLPVVKRDGKWHYDIDTLEGRRAAIETSAKQNCLVGDFGGNTKRLGPINDPVVPVKKGSGKGGTAPVRECPQCGIYNHASVRECEFCGFEFPVHLNIETKAGTDALIASDEDVKEYFEVDSITYKAHTKPGKPTSLEVSYYCKMRVFREFVCLSHTSAIRYRAEKWWRERCDIPPPNTTEEAIKSGAIDHLRAPERILVVVNKRYPEIISYVFPEPSRAAA